MAEWLECWTQVNFTRARGPGFDSWTDPSKIARPQDSHVVTCPAGGPGKTRLTRPSTPSSSMELGGRAPLARGTVAELYPGNIEILA